MIAAGLDIASAPATVQAIAAAGALLGLWLGAEAATRFATALAFKLGVSPLVIGLTLVSVASSLPEIFVNITAVLGGDDDIAAGNVVGSCLVQITLVLGLCGVVAGVLPLAPRAVRRDGSMVLIANLAMIAVILDGAVTTSEAAVLIVAYASYIALVVATAKRADGPGAPRDAEEGGGEGDGRAEDGAPAFHRLPFATLAVGLVASVVFVWAMADILVAVGKSAGREMGLSDAIIGLWVGAGTTFPELAISLAAIWRGKTGLSVGNLLGSNVTDPLLSLGIGVVVAGGIGISPAILTSSLVWLATTLLAVGLLWSRGGVTRVSGLVLIAAYVASQAFLISQ